MADSIWWTKMLHKEDFCEHFCEMSDKEIVDDIRKSIASFMKQREEGEDFGAKMVHKAKLRIDAVHDVRSDAGKQGGRPRKGDNGEVAVVAPKVVDEDSHRTAAASLAYSGQNGLVRLSDDEYNLLLQKIGNKRKADKLIDDLDYAIAEGKTFKQPHLHVLTHWQSYREDKAEEAAETAKARAAANAEAFGNVDRRTPYQKNQDDLLRLYQETSAALKAM
jgi:hypothetical protein